MKMSKIHIVPSKEGSKVQVAICDSDNKAIKILDFDDYVAALANILSYVTVSLELSMEELSFLETVIGYYYDHNKNEETRLHASNILQKVIMLKSPVTNLLPAE